MFDRFLSLLHTPLSALPWPMHIVISLTVLWGTFFTFYVLYLATINLWGNRHEVSVWVLVFAWPLLLSMLVVDTTMNWTFFTIIMLDFPREFMVTQRMTRYRRQGLMNWRKQFATYLCTRLLNPFDPTKDHC